MPQTFNVGARSLFVTVTAWVFIVAALLSCLTAVVQSAAMASLLPGFSVAGDIRPLPLLTGLLMGYLPWVVGTGLALSLATLASAVGLLLRLEWARRSFIALLVLAIVAHLAGIWLHQEVVQSLVDSTLSRAPLPPAAAVLFGGLVTTARAAAIAMSLGACALLVWIIRRLMSPMVRQEFA